MAKVLLLYWFPVIGIQRAIILPICPLSPDLEIVPRLTCILTLDQKVSANMRDFRHFKNRDKSPHFKENAHIAQ